jgi:Cu/Zn superoxide dismutase
MTVLRTFTAAAVIVAALGAFALAQSGQPMASRPSAVVVHMNAENGSGESGTATLTQQPGGVQVAIAITGAPSGVAQPAHIHEGTCAKLNPAPKYPLTNVTDGKSTTVVHGITIKDLLARPFAVNVHKSAADLKTYVSCGDIRAKAKSSSTM